MAEQGAEGKKRGRFGNLKRSRKPKKGPEEDAAPQVKPILKTGVKPVPTPKKRKAGRIKSVTILGDGSAPESEAEPPKPKPTTITGFQETTVPNVFIILLLWSIRFFIPWIDAWHEFNFYLLREPSYWDPLERKIWLGEVIIFCIRCLYTVALSVFVDFLNLKFYAYLVQMVLFALSPVAGAFLNGALAARLYDPDYYYQWAFTTHFVFHAIFSLAYAAIPLQLSCMYSQEPNMSRQAHFNWAALLIFLESVNRYVCFWVIPGRCPTRTFTQVAVWFALGVGVILAALVMANAFDFAKKEMFRFRQRMKDDVDVNVKLKKSIWFSLILASLVVTTFLFATLERLKPDESWDKHYALSASSMFILGKILGAVVMSVVTTCLRHFKPKMNLKIMNPEYLALGLPHLINCFALLILFGRFATLSLLPEGSVIVGPIPRAGEGMMVVEFYNFDFRNVTLCVHSKYFRPLKIGPRERGTREIPNPLTSAFSDGSSRVYFRVTTDPALTPGASRFESFPYHDGTWATYIISVQNRIFTTDVEIFLMHLDVILVHGTENLSPEKEPQIFFMNSFIEYFPEDQPRTYMFSVEQKESGFYEQVLAPTKWNSFVMKVPTGVVHVSFFVNRQGGYSVNISVHTENYCTYGVLMGYARPFKPGANRTAPMRMMKSYLTTQVAGPESKILPSKAEMQRDAAVMAGMTFAGMASSGFFIGIVYMFWVDTPFVEYRTTSIAVFWVCLEIPEELSKIKVVDVGPVVISTLLFLQVICIVVHFTSAMQMYTPQFNFRKRPD